MTPGEQKKVKLSYLYLKAPETVFLPAHQSVYHPNHLLTFSPNMRIHRIIY